MLFDSSVGLADPDRLYIGKLGRIGLFRVPCPDPDQTATLYDRIAAQGRFLRNACLAGGPNTGFIGAKVKSWSAMAIQEKQVKTSRDPASATRQIILPAALQVFSDRCLEGASTRAIAAQAGLEQGHLAFCFPSQMALWKAVIEFLSQEGETRLRAALENADHGDAAAKVQMALPELLRSFAENPKLTRLMLQEFSVQSPRHNWVVENFGRPVWDMLRPFE